MSKLRIKKPWVERHIPKKMLTRIRREMGEEGARLFQLLCELAEEDGQIHFDGDENQMIEAIQALYAFRFGGGEDA